MHQQTIDTYNQSAKQLADYFRGIGPRQKYIDLAFKAAGNSPRAHVFEIGCGDGRDAKAIVEKAAWYEGLDISSGLIQLAREHVPGMVFHIADAATYQYPDNLDIVFAFASILHLDKQELQTVLQKVQQALKPGGIFYISSKWAADYTEHIKEDQYGKRLFYLYNADLVTGLMGKNYEVVDTWRETQGHTEWFELVLKTTV